jgi:hypothetical protein
MLQILRSCPRKHIEEICRTLSPKRLDYEARSDGDKILPFTGCCMPDAGTHAQTLPLQEILHVHCLNELRFGVVTHAHHANQSYARALRLHQHLSLGKPYHQPKIWCTTVSGLMISVPCVSRLFYSRSEVPSIEPNNLSAGTCVPWFSLRIDDQ